MAAAADLAAPFDLTADGGGVTDFAAMDSARADLANSDSSMSTDLAMRDSSTADFAATVDMTPSCTYPDCGGGGGCQLCGYGHACTQTSDCASHRCVHGFCAAATLSFAAGMQFTAPESLRNPRLADMNNDGNLDVVVVSNNAGLLNVLLGDGKGMLGAPLSANVAGPGVAAACVGDLNNDGKLDAAALYAGKFEVFLGRGDGQLLAMASYSTTGSSGLDCAIADLDGDGKRDVVMVAQATGTNVFVFRGVGDGTFMSPTQYASNGSGPTGVALGDLDGDGHPDAVVANVYGNSISVLYSDASANLSVAAVYPVVSNPWAAAIGDLDGDGRPDVAATSGGTTGIGLFFNSGNRTFKPRSDVTIPSCTGVVLADFDGDGVPDIGGATSAAPQSLTIALGRGDGTFQSAQSFGPMSSQFLAAGDLDHDGRVDAVLTNLNTGGKITVLLNTSN